MKKRIYFKKSGKLTHVNVDGLTNTKEDMQTLGLPAMRRQVGADINSPIMVVVK